MNNPPFYHVLVDSGRGWEPERRFNLGGDLGTSPKVFLDIDSAHSSVYIEHMLCDIFEDRRRPCKIIHVIPDPT